MPSRSCFNISIPRLKIHQFVWGFFSHLCPFQLCKYCLFAFFLPILESLFTVQLCRVSINQNSGFIKDLGGDQRENVISLLLFFFRPDYTTEKSAQKVHSIFNFLSELFSKRIVPSIDSSRSAMRFLAYLLTNNSSSFNWRYFALFQAL